MLPSGVCGGRTSKHKIRCFDGFYNNDTFLCCIQNWTISLALDRDTMIIDLDVLINAIEEDDCLGFCTTCGEEQYGCEPDARNYECETCGAFSVFGAEELLISQGA